MALKSNDLIDIARSASSPTKKPHTKAIDKTKTAQARQQQQAQAETLHKIKTDNAQLNWSFQKKRAVLLLNILRYCVALYFVVILLFAQLGSFIWSPLGKVENTTLLLFCTILLFVTATSFSYILQLPQTLRYYNWLIFSQLSVDLTITALLCHVSGGIYSEYSTAYFIIVATGSIVLPQKRALGLAAGSFLLIFYQHIYSFLHIPTENSFFTALLPRDGILLFIIAWVISSLSKKIDPTPLNHSGFNANKESLDSFLQNEEIKALQAALTKSNGNKTEAAESLGMSFRSFRYKLKKYQIESE